jgi:tetratricopeptide (TPR) repeat protein
LLARRASLTLLLIAIAGAAMAVPSILIVRIKPAIKELDTKEQAETFPVADAFANEVQAGGRMAPVVWGLTDPIYRDAVQNHTIRTGEDMPTLDAAKDVASKLHCDYVFAIDLKASEDGLLTKAWLYRRGSLIWSDPQVDLSAGESNLRKLLKAKQITKKEFDQRLNDLTYRTSSVQIGARFGLEDSLRSLARTWVEQLNSTALKPLPQNPIQPTPDPAKGDQPVKPTLPVPERPKPTADNSWKAAYTASEAAGDHTKSINILRDAIDAAPLDADRRLALISVLRHAGMYEAAALEARRDAEMIPENIAFRTLAARAWMEAGNAEEAQVDLREAVARAPGSVDTLTLLGETSIAKGEFDSALASLNQAVAAGATPETYFVRALAYTLLGRDKEASEDLKQANAATLDAQDEETRYGLIASLFDEGAAGIGGDIRTLHQRAQVARKDNEVKALAATYFARVKCRANFIAGISAPKAHASSHNRRVLAYKLLSQCLTDLDSFIKSGDEDVLTDSRINLGEALKQVASARQAFRTEQQGTPKSDVRPGNS